MMKAIEVATAMAIITSEGEGGGDDDDREEHEEKNEQDAEQHDGHDYGDDWR